MTLKVEVDPAYGSVSGARFRDMEGSESVPLLIPDPPPAARERAWKPLSREELEKRAGGPEWRRFRCRLVICFWICWLVMLAAAVVVVIQSPRPETPVLRWWQRDLIYRLQPAIFLDVDREQDSRINRVSERLPYLKSLGAGAVILVGVFGNRSSPINLTEIDRSLGTLPQFTQLIAESRKEGVRVMLDLCELDLFEEESNNDTKVWSGASKSIQYSLRFWLDHGVSGFGICDTDAAYSAETLMEWNELMREFSAHDDERILMVKQTGNTLPVLKESNITASIVELVIKSLIPPSHHQLSVAEVVEAMEVILQTPQRDWPSWTVGGGVPLELNRAILVLIMTLPGTPIITYGDELNLAQDVNRMNLALFHSLSQSRAREEALQFGRFTFLSFNGSLSSPGLNSTATPPLAFLRSWGCVHFLVLLNLGPEPQTLDPGWAPSLPEGGVIVTSTGLDRFGPVSLNTIKIQPHEAIVLKLFESDNSS